METMTALESLLPYWSGEKVVPEQGLPSLLHFLPLAEVVMPGAVAAVL